MSAQGRTELFETAPIAKALATMALLFLLKATPHNTVGLCGVALTISSP